MLKIYFCIQFKAGLWKQHQIPEWSTPGSHIGLANTVILLNK